MRGVGLVCVVLSLIACRPESRGRADAADPGGGDDEEYDPYCHYDCFGFIECSGNLARLTVSEPVPCSEWTGSCPGAEVTCSEGCDLPVDIFYEYHEYVSYDLDIYCAETPPTQIGDPCVNDCLPTRAVADETGTVTQTYLTCDPVSDTCAAAEPPVIDGYLAPCPETAAAHAGQGVTGVARATPDAEPDAGPFPEIWCLLAWDEAAQTMRHGMTVRCVGDWQCPEGASCDASLAAIPAGAEPPGPVCRPGARGAPLAEHLPPRS